MDAKIYICTHADFECPVKNPIYLIIDSREIFENDKAPNGIDGLFYSELISYKYIADKKEELPKYIGFCGYRKYFEFLDLIPDLEELIKENGCIVAKPHFTTSLNVYLLYAKCFNYEDMDIARTIIKEKYPDLYETFEDMLKKDKLYICNMFIMKKEDFLELIDIIWNVLDTYLDIIGKDIKNRILNNKNYRLKKNNKSRSLEELYRIGGNLGERITSAFIMNKFKNPKCYKIFYTENARPHKKL